MFGKADRDIVYKYHENLREIVTKKTIITKESKCKEN